MVEFCRIKRGALYHRQFKVEGCQDNSRFGYVEIKRALDPTIEGFSLFPQENLVGGTFKPLSTSMWWAAAPTEIP
jgi:hypothetical protein